MRAIHINFSKYISEYMSAYKSIRIRITISDILSSYYMYMSAENVPVHYISKIYP